MIKKTIRTSIQGKVHLHHLASLVPLDINNNNNNSNNSNSNRDHDRHWWIPKYGRVGLSPRLHCIRSLPVMCQ